MVEAVVLKVTKRDGKGTRKAGRLRKQGLTPAVVYGHKEATESIALSQEDLDHAIRQGARIIDLDLDGKVQKTLVKEVQWDYLGKEILHVDFARVSADERVEVPVPIVLKGVAPGVVGGGVLDQPMHALRVECPAIGIPEAIRVNIGELQVGGVIHVRDLTLPADVKALEDADAVVVHVTSPLLEPEPGAEAAAQAEPEVIGRRAAAEEGEEE